MVHDQWISIGQLENHLQSSASARGFQPRYQTHPGRTAGYRAIKECWESKCLMGYEQQGTELAAALAEVAVVVRSRFCEAFAIAFEAEAEAGWGVERTLSASPSWLRPSYSGRPVDAGWLSRC